MCRIQRFEPSRGSRVFAIWRRENGIDCELRLVERIRERDWYIRKRRSSKDGNLERLSRHRSYRRLSGLSFRPNGFSSTLIWRGGRCNRRSTRFPCARIWDAKQKWEAMDEPREFMIARIIQLKLFFIFLPSSITPPSSETIPAPYTLQISAAFFVSVAFRVSLLLQARTMIGVSDPRVQKACSRSESGSRARGSVAS